MNKFTELSHWLQYKTIHSWGSNPKKGWKYTNLSPNLATTPKRAAEYLAGKIADDYSYSEVFHRVEYNIITLKKVPKNVLTKYLTNILQDKITSNKIYTRLSEELNKRNK